jgi:predicted ester cyclase
MKRPMKLRVFLLPLFTASVLGCSAGAGNSNSLADNKAIVLRSESKLWSKGDLAVADQLYSPEFVCHFIIGPKWRGVEGIKEQVRQHRTSFPDWTERVDDIVAEGDRVVIRFTSTGTHRGTFAGIAPTDRKVTIQEMAIFRVVGGKIVEQWGQPDLNGLLEQLRAP